MLSPSVVTARHAVVEPMGARLSPAAQILCTMFFFLTDPWEEGNGKKANRKHREARLKHSQCEQSAPLSTASAWDFPKRDTLSVSVISVQGIPASLTMMARDLQQSCVEICSSSKAFLDLNG